MRTFYRNADIEAVTETRLVEMERAMGKPLTLPIPIDYLAEQVLGLSLLWDEVDELPGEMILGAIMPAKQLIILNERRRAFMDEHQGVERSTKAHEAGHWDLYVDKATLGHPVLFDDDDEGPFALRSSPVGDVAIIKKLEESPEGRELLRQIDKRADEPDEARVVNRYGAAISMPRALIEEEIRKIDRTSWPALYRLRERFDVTISALVVRLQQLDLLYVKGKQLFELLARLHPFRLDSNAKFSVIRHSLAQMHTYCEPEDDRVGRIFARHVGRGDVMPLLEMPQFSETVVTA